MIEFKVHSGNPEVTQKATMEDRGLCYVSRFVVENGPEIISYIAQEVATAATRGETDREALRTYGYEIDEDSLR
jgi:hypothetical protein